MLLLTFALYSLIGIAMALSSHIISSATLSGSSYSFPSSSSIFNASSSAPFNTTTSTLAKSTGTSDSTGFINSVSTFSSATTSSTFFNTTTSSTQSNAAASSTSSSSISTNPSTTSSVSSPSATSNLNATNPGCGFGKLDAKDWQQDDIDAWLQSWWSSVQLTLNTQNFTRQLLKSFAPDVSNSAFTCNVFQQCLFPGCQSMDFQQAPSREAYFVLDAIANSDNYLEPLVTGIDNAQTDSNSFTDKWVTQYPYTTVQPASTSRILEILNQIAAGLLILLTIASVAVPGLGELTVAGASVAATTQAIGAGAGAAAGVQSGILPAVANALPSAQ